MKITEFNDRITIGDTVIILDGHGENAKPLNSDWKYTFHGFAHNCTLCPDCQGYVKLFRNGEDYTDCFRSYVAGNIRLKIITPKILPDNLFEI